MKKRMCIGIDFGGSSSKATLIDEEGKIVATSTKEYPSYCPQPGWVEQNPSDLYDALVYNVQTLIKKSRIDCHDIVAVAIDAATHMAVFADENDKPIRNIIHWSDNRCSEQVARLKENNSDLLQKYSCNAISPCWNLPQILWLQEHEPETLEKTKRIYFAKDYIRHCLTGDFYTDYIEAMGAMLADDHNIRWADELCSLAGISASMLPEIKAPGDIAGYVSEKAANDTGLAKGTPVLVGSTDTAMEVYASGAIEEGYATIKLATAGRICLITSHAIQSRQFFNYRHIIPGLWYPGTGTRSCASSYKWFRDVFGDYETARAEQENADAYELLNQLASETPTGSSNLFFHPYLMGEATPYYDDKLRASFTGISMYHGKGHFARAVMEGVSYSMRDCMEEIKTHNINAKQYRIIGGGAKSALWSQILSDVLGESLLRTQNNDSSLGSAMLAGVVSGMFKDYTDSVEKCVKVSGRIDPNEANVKIYDKGFRVYKEIQKALSAVYRDSF